MKVKVRCVCLGLLSLLLVGCEAAGFGALEFNLTFKNAKGLKPGQPVVYNGVPIGEVTALELGDDRLAHASVRISPEHRDKVYREARFVVAKPGGFLDTSGERQITMEDRDGDRTEIARGETLEGSEGFWGEAAEQAKGALTAARDRLSAFLDSPEGQELRESVREFSARAAQLTAEKYQQFRDEQLPVLTEEAMRLKKQLEDDGQFDKAKELWREFSQWREEVGAP